MQFSLHKTKNQYLVSYPPYNIFISSLVQTNVMGLCRAIVDCLIDINEKVAFTDENIRYSRLECKSHTLFSTLFSPPTGTTPCSGEVTWVPL